MAFSANPVTLSKSIVMIALVACTGIGLAMGINPPQAAWIAFLGATLICGWVVNRNAAGEIEIERRHRPRVFEDDQVPVTLAVRQRSGSTKTLVVVEDEFTASLSVRRRHLIPMLTRQWEAHLHYVSEAERHRGIYLLGPARVIFADPMGLFATDRTLECVTPLTVYPRPIPLENYTWLGPRPRNGPTMESFRRIGQGEEIISVRPYQRGDSPSRLHWRTSARRGAWHVIELDAMVQSSVMLYLDMSRMSRFGAGAESTVETALGCATSLLSEAAGKRHRVGVGIVRDTLDSILPGEGVAHLRALLDRIAVLEPRGELDFWLAVEKDSANLKSGSRAIMIVSAARTLSELAVAVVSGLSLRGVAVDVILLDESGMIRIWKDQIPTTADAHAKFDDLSKQLVIAGARVLPLIKGQSARDLAHLD